MSHIGSALSLCTLHDFNVFVQVDRQLQHLRSRLDQLSPQHSDASVLAEQVRPRSRGALPGHAQVTELQTRCAFADWVCSRQCLTLGTRLPASAMTAFDAASQVQALGTCSSAPGLVELPLLLWVCRYIDGISPATCLAQAQLTSHQHLTHKSCLLELRSSGTAFLLRSTSYQPPSAGAGGPYWPSLLHLCLC